MYTKKINENYVLCGDKSHTVMTWYSIYMNLYYYLHFLSNYTIPDKKVSDYFKLICNKEYKDIQSQGIVCKVIKFNTKEEADHLIDQYNAIIVLEKLRCRKNG